MLKPSQGSRPADKRNKTSKPKFTIDQIVTPANMKIEPLSRADKVETGKDKQQPQSFGKDTKPQQTPREQSSRSTPSAAKSTVSVAKDKVSAAAAVAPGMSLKRLGMISGFLCVLVAGLIVITLGTGGGDMADAAAGQDVAPTVVTFEPKDEDFPIATAEEDILAKITSGTLAALRDGGSEVAQPATTAEPQAAVATTALYGMVLQAVQQGQSKAYIDRLLNEAYVERRIEVPLALILANGRVDTNTILAAFVGN